MLKLVIGNKNYSSWSMRPWLALRANDIPFEEVFIPLYTDDKADKDRILSFSRAGKVPALIDGDVTVWDSLSIIEYLAEKFPQSRLWPEDWARRAHARSISAEMHSGFMVGTSAVVAFRARKASTARRKAGTVRTTMGLRGIWSRSLAVSDGVRGSAPGSLGEHADLIRRERCRQDNSAMANLRQLDAYSRRARGVSSRRRTVEVLDAPTADSS